MHDVISPYILGKDFDQVNTGHATTPPFQICLFNAGRAFWIVIQLPDLHQLKSQTLDEARNPAKRRVCPGSSCVIVDAMVT